MKTSGMLESTSGGRKGETMNSGCWRCQFPGCKSKLRVPVFKGTTNKVEIFPPKSKRKMNSLSSRTCISLRNPPVLLICWQNYFLVRMEPHTIIKGQPFVNADASWEPLSHCSPMWYSHKCTRLYRCRGEGSYLIGSPTYHANQWSLSGADKAFPPCTWTLLALTQVQNVRNHLFLLRI